MPYALYSALQVNRPYPLKLQDEYLFQEFCAALPQSLRAIFNATSSNPWSTPASANALSKHSDKSALLPESPRLQGKSLLNPFNRTILKRSKNLFFLHLCVWSLSCVTPSPCQVGVISAQPITSAPYMIYTFIVSTIDHRFLLLEVPEIFIWSYTGPSPAAQNRYDFNSPYHHTKTIFSFSLDHIIKTPYI